LDKVIVIGSGFAGLSAACFLAKSGADVTVIEKNGTPGGRARAFSQDGFTFDMGPSWYWMPDVFEKFFAHFNKTPSYYYDLIRLDPSYRVIWKDGVTDVPANYDALRQLFESIEKGAAMQLDKFMREAQYKYHAAMDKLVYKPGLSVTEFMHGDVLKAFFKIDLLTSMQKHARRFFTHPKLLQLIEFPVLFLGALPANTPALYSLMNYADMKLGTWYPMGGMVQVVNAMYALAKSMGVKFIFNAPVQKIHTVNSEIYAVETNEDSYIADAFVGACDYHHLEQLLPQSFRNYNDEYWQARSMSPSCLLYYIGVSKKLNNLKHHNLFFDADFKAHANDLYKKPQWPRDPLMYVCCPSKTDSSVAPAECENIFILIPVAPGMADTTSIREQYYNMAINKLELHTKQSLRNNIVYKKSYAHNDFVTDYNAFKGNAYGLSNTLMQTAFMKPSVRNRKLRNLFYTGQLTVPGPGVPPAIISGEIVAAQVLQSLTLKTQTV